MTRHFVSDETRIAIREMRLVNPKMTYREIARLFGLSTGGVCLIINTAPAARHDDPPKPIVKQSPVTEPTSIIRPIPRDRLMAGNGRCARPIHSTP